MLDKLVGVETERGKDGDQVGRVRCREDGADEEEQEEADTVTREEVTNGRVDAVELTGGRTDVFNTETLSRNKSPGDQGTALQPRAPERVKVRHRPQEPDERERRKNRNAMRTTTSGGWVLKERGWWS